MPLKAINSVQERSPNRWLLHLTTDDLTAAATTQTIVGPTVKDGDFVKTVFLWTKTAFSGGTLASFDVNIGVSTNPGTSTDILADAFNLFAAGSDDGRGGSNDTSILGITGDDTVDFVLTATGDDIDNITAGEAFLLIEITNLEDLN